MTGQPAQILRALSTPTPSLGKKTFGGYRRQFPCIIQEVAPSLKGCVSSIVVLPVAEGVVSVVCTTVGDSIPFPRSWKPPDPSIRFTSLFGGGTAAVRTAAAP